MFWQATWFSNLKPGFAHSVLDFAFLRDTFGFCTYTGLVCGLAGSELQNLVLEPKTGLEGYTARFYFALRFR